MKKKIITNIRVEISGLYVSRPRMDDRGWYNFDWAIWVNGKKKDYGNYDGTFSVPTASATRHSLKRGYAMKLVLDRII